MLPEADRPVVARALAKDPDERFPSCMAFIRSLAVGAGPATSGSGRRDRAARRAGRRGRRSGRTVHDVDLTPGRGATRGGRRDAAAAQRGPRQSQAHVEPRRDRRGPPARGRPPPQKEVGVLRPTDPDRHRQLRPAGTAGAPLPADRPRRRRGPGAVLPLPVRRLRPGRGRQGRPRPAGRGPAPDEVFHVPLQPVTQYRRRQLEQILDWLPREKLYSIPRSLQPAGRGRSAGWRSATTTCGSSPGCGGSCRSPRTRSRSRSRRTRPGLSPRDNTPQVYVFASAAGGSGGMLIDLGYAVRARAWPDDHRRRPDHRVRVRRGPDRSGHIRPRTGQPLRRADRTEPLRRPRRDVHRPATAGRRGRRSRGRGCRSPRRICCRCRSDRPPRSATACPTWPGMSLTT